jgi:thiol-disulfide isomerase/thioredoxin
MQRAMIRCLVGAWSPILGVWLAAVAEAAAPSVEQALKLRPMQQEVDFAQPAAQEAAKCTIHARRIDGRGAWIVQDPDGLVLRKFVDTNGDNVVDQWSYYKDGLEVYRDIDADFNGKADQYRWFHTGGSRWGLDKDEDGQIDAWKTISAEEVTAEVVGALASRDAKRFSRLVLTPAELNSLGLGKEKAQKVGEKITQLAAGFQTLAARQKTVTSETRWVQFSGTMPGIVPAGTDGSSKDLRVYENVVAIVQTGEAHGQVQIGTLVQVGDVWRVIDLPQVATEGQAELSASGFFFQASIVRRSAAAEAGTDERGQQLLAELEKLDQGADQATAPQQQAQLNARRAELLKQIAQAAHSPQDRAMWLRQLADMLSAAVQSGTFPDGVARLEGLLKELEGNQGDKDLAAYVKFRQLTAAYGLGLQAPKADFAKIQTQWLKDLQQYVADYPTSPDAAEAMLQMAIAQEFAGEEGEAKQWYGRVVQSFPDSSAAKKAAGARTRLDSVGKSITLRGKSPDGDLIDLAKYRGRVVLIQYWATWCEPCKRDMPVLKQLAAKYPRSFTVLGVSLDRSPKDLAAYLAENRLPWPQIFEEGGLDSDPANQLGILTLPTMILVDKQGKVVDRNIQTADLESELKKLIP